MTAAEVFFTLFAAICWLAALSGHALLLKLLLTAGERAKLRLPPAPGTSSTFSSWPLLLPLLLSITTVDLATLLFAIPFTTISRIFADWTFGEVICRFSAFLGIAAVTVDSYAFLALMVVCCQIAQRKRRALQGGGESSITKKKTFLIIGGIWIFALITALPALFYQKVTTIEDVLQQTMDQVMAVFSGHYQQSNDLSSSLAKAMRAQASGVFSQHFCTPMGVLGSAESRYIYTFLQFFIPIFATMVIYVVMLIDKWRQSGDLAEEFVLQQRAQLPPSEAAVMNNDAKVGGFNCDKIIR